MDDVTTLWVQINVSTELIDGPEFTDADIDSMADLAAIAARNAIVARRSA